jgi:hypothetical protein
MRFPTMLPDWNEPCRKRGLPAMAVARRLAGVINRLETKRRVIETKFRPGLSPDSRLGC